MTPITGAECLKTVQGQLVSGSPDVVMTGVCRDAREVQPGDLFVAFQGQRVDGHSFVRQAFENGASAALVTRPLTEEEGAGQGTLIQVPDALKAIQSLAARERSLFSGPVIGVTGSNGKTTTKEMLAAVFQTAGPCLFTQGNYNNELGMPLTILQRSPAHGAMVLEMGMRGYGQIQALCEIARPTAGVITNIGQSHIELLGSQEGIANAKSELLDALPLDGIAVINGDDDWLRAVSHRFRGTPLWYGLGEQNDAYATEITTTPTGTRFVVHVGGQKEEVHLGTYGVHNVRNALSALLMGFAHGLSLSEMARSLGSFEGSSGRLHIQKGREERTVIDDSYNASPLSVKASLDVLTQLAPKGTAYAILGDMYELGDYQQQGHREVGAYCVTQCVDGLITIGPLSADTSQAAKTAGMNLVWHFETKELAIAQLEDILPKGSYVLVKASRGMRLEDIAQFLIR